ncbi:MAG: PEGA domain-containing protein [Myxococcales bacterium]|nr:PEGA domain-containing protein [Myxococcales bacterium]
MGSALKPTRPNPLRRLLTPTGITVLGLLALLTFAGIKFLPTLLAEAQPKKATLVVESVPPGADVALDGQSTGQQTEARIEGLLAGSTHKVSLTLAGYEPRTETVEITPEELKQGEEIRRRIFLHKARGRLKITSDPIRAEVYLNGKYIGDTPLDRDGLDREKNEIQLLLRKEGFRETREVLTWGEETVIEHHFAMTPRGG